MIGCQQGLLIAFAEGQRCLAEENLERMKRHLRRSRPGLPIKVGFECQYCGTKHKENRCESCGAPQ